MEKSGTDTGSVTGNRVASQAKWTFMVYMAGDNNLDGAALRDIAEMARAGSTKDINILVQLDRIEVPRAGRPAPQRRNRAGAFSITPSRKNTGASAMTTPPAATPWTTAS